jgi:hypothetical protein
MDQPNSRTGSMLLKGCGAGCLALLALGTLFGVWAWMAAKDAIDQPSTPEENQTARELPPIAPPSPAAATDPNAPIPSAGEIVPAEATGRLILDLSMGEFEIVPVAAGESLRVESRYDTSRFRLTESFDTDADGRWTQRITFGPKRKFLMGQVNAGENLVRVFVPAGHRIDLEAEVSMGESRLDLSTLNLARVDLELSMGDHRIQIDQPGPSPADSFLVDSKMGQMTIRGLGWASPATASFDHSMGELDLSLDGAWQRDGSIDLDATMGPIRLRVPEDVDLRLEATTVKIGARNEDDRATPPPGAPILTVTSDVTMGELDVSTVTRAPATEEPSAEIESPAPE